MLFRVVCLTLFGALSWGITSGQPTVLYDISIILDASGSPDTISFRQAVINIFQVIPSLVDKYGIERLFVYHFGSDGWNLKPIEDVNFPPIPADSGPAIRTAFWLPLPNIKTGYEEHLKKKTDAFRAARREYIANILKGTAERALPHSASPCTDLNSVFDRSLLPTDDLEHLIIIVTDGAENCSTALGWFSKPENLHLLVVLTPEDPNQPGATSIATLGGAEQFRITSSKIKESVPGATVIPYFVTDLEEEVAKVIQH